MCHCIESVLCVGGDVWTSVLDEGAIFGNYIVRSESFLVLKRRCRVVAYGVESPAARIENCLFKLPTLLKSATG